MTSSGWTGRCARWSRPVRAALAVALLASSGCFPREGTGDVRAAFTVTDCPPGDDNGGLEGYGYEAKFLGTARFQSTLTLQIFQHKSLPEETDGLAVRLELDALLAQGVLTPDPVSERYLLTAPPARVPVAFDAPGAEVNLSLFQTCPDFPTVHGVAGTLTLDELRVAVDPEGTGHDEHVAGTLTASVARGVPLEVVGTVEAHFDFDVPRRPLMTFQ